MFSSAFHEEFILHASKAFFASAWMDACDESEDGPNLSGCEIMDVMPSETDPAAVHAARTLMMDMERANGNNKIEALYDLICRVSEGEGDREHTVEMFAHYAAMQAMGHGVGLYDAFGKRGHDAIKVPYVEFGSYSLSRAYF